jgi:putative MATE family efflux protein
MRGVGNTRLPFFCALVANALNVLLNYCLILGNLGFPSLGVRGAAIGTVVSMFVNMLLLAAVFRRGVLPNLRLPLQLARIDRPLAKELYKIGAPAALDMVILNAGFLSIVGFLGRIDEVAVAAHGIGLRVQGLAFVPGLAISQATGAMVGQALGAGDVERARRITRASIALCCAIMTALALVFVFAAYPLVHVFDVPSHSTMEAYSVQWLRLLGYGMLPVGVHIALMGLLHGAGATNTSLRINLVTTLALQIPLGAILGFGFDLGALGVWLSLPLAFIAKAAMEYAAYKRERWAVTGVTIDSAA